MKEDFEQWADGKVAIDHYKGEYANLEAQIAWQAWQRAWNIAVRAQREKDEIEIRSLHNKLRSIVSIASTKFVGER
jgi:hypothetical protein